MRERNERVRPSLHSGWLDGTQAVALVEGVVERLEDLDEDFRHPKALLFANGIGATTLFGKRVGRYTN